MARTIIAVAFTLATLCSTVYAQTTETYPYQVPPPEPTEGTRSIPIGANLTTVEIYNQYHEAYENVTYYTNSYGEAVYDDDIIWGSEALLLSWRASSNEAPGPNKKRWYAVKPQYGWPSFPIKFRYDSDATKTKLQTYVYEALDKWRALAPYLSFDELDPDPTFAQVSIYSICLNYHSYHPRASLL